jgi:hypothetical protein
LGSRISSISTVESSFRYASSDLLRLRDCLKQSDPTPKSGKRLIHASIETHALDIVVAFPDWLLA